MSRQPMLGCRRGRETILKDLVTVTGVRRGVLTYPSPELDPADGLNPIWQVHSCLVYLGEHVDDTRRGI